MTDFVNICDVCSAIFAGGDAPRNNMSTEKTEEYSIPIYSNGEANDGLYGFTNFARVLEPSITISARGTIGYTAIRNAPFVPIVRLITLTPIPELIDIKYLYYAAKNYKFDGSGTSIPQLTVPALKKYTFPLPTMDEQRRIVLLLDKVSSIIEKQKQQLQKLDELVKARFVEMFGDPVANEKKWNTKPLLKIGTCKNGMNFHYADDGVKINCLGVGDFKDYSIISDISALPTVSINEMPTNEYMLKDDDIVFVRSNGNKALVGRSVAVYPGNIPTTFSGFCIRYRKTDDTVNIPYLLRVLKADSIRKKMAGRGANIQNLNQQILSTLTIPVPPMELQNQFATFVEQVDKSKFAVQKALDEAQTLFDSLMQEYFG